MKSRSLELHIHRGLTAKKDDELVLKHTMIIQTLGAVLNVAQMVSIREDAMSSFKFKKDADNIQKIADRIMTAKLGLHNFQLKEDVKELMQYDYSIDLYRIFSHLVGKAPEYIKMVADELEHKEKLYQKLLKDAKQI